MTAIIQEKKKMTTKEQEIQALKDKIKEIQESGSSKPAYTRLRKESARINKELKGEESKKYAFRNLCEEIIAMLSEQEEETED